MGEMYRVAVDIGGTFTDLVATSSGHGRRVVKVPSTPPEAGAGLEGQELGLPKISLGHSQAVIGGNAQTASFMSGQREGSRDLAFLRIVELETVVVYEQKRGWAGKGSRGRAAGRVEGGNRPFFQDAVLIEPPDCRRVAPAAGEMLPTPA